ncbi:very long chain fatty acid elongase 7 [Aphomia sociella]
MEKEKPLCIRDVCGGSRKLLLRNNAQKMRVPGAQGAWEHQWHHEYDCKQNGLLVMSLPSQVDVVYTDYSRAFDRIDHDILLEKLQQAGIRVRFVERWPLIDPSEIAFILATYLVFVLKIGPIIMERRTPFQIKGILLAYNAFKVINSSVLSFKFLSYILENGLFPRKCQHDNLTLYIIASLYWKYMITKLLDLFDTVFFVIRKKYSQVTFLHMYHHVFMVVVTWSCLRYDPSDHWAFMAAMNCFIHAVMYIYYGIAALGPGYAKYIWWKKYLTLIQLIQFVLVMLHIVVQTYTSECPIHGGTYWVGLANIVLFIFLFVDFYNKRYRTRCNKKFIEFLCAKRVD